VDESDPPPAVPANLVVVAYALAALCALVPLAVIGAGFAGFVLVNRGRVAEGAGVLALAVACTALGLTVLR
jgi:hypothetical protein